MGKNSYWRQRWPVTTLRLKEQFRVIEIDAMTLARAGAPEECAGVRPARRLSAWAAARLYRRGYNRVATGGELRRRYGGGWLDRGLGRLLGFLDPQTRLLIVKDFRTFRRDPAQWAQILIFTGLLALYFVNTRRFYQEDIPFAYQNGVSLLNL